MSKPMVLDWCPHCTAWVEPDTCPHPLQCIRRLVYNQDGIVVSNSILPDIDSFDCNSITEEPFVVEGAPQP